MRQASRTFGTGVAIAAAIGALAALVGFTLAVAVAAVVT